MIAIDFTRKIVLIGGTTYAGEMKKSVFTTLNYFLPAAASCRCIARPMSGRRRRGAVLRPVRHRQDHACRPIPTRTLIGDDEHGWGRQGIFNFEGGCYAKTIKLSAEAEPEIYATTHRFGTVLENVVFDPDTREPDFDDGSKTENTRCAYPLDFIPNASKTGRAGHPKNIIMLTADAFGVMPPIAKLTPGAGDVSLPLRLHRQGRRHREGRHGAAADVLHLLRRAVSAAPSVRIRQPADRNDRQNEVDCWLVNTGWTGGKYGVGRRMPIKVTRTLLAAVLDGSLKNAAFRTDPYFGFSVPTAVRGVDPPFARSGPGPGGGGGVRPARRRGGEVLRDIFVKFQEHVDPEVRAAAPAVRIAGG